MEEKIESQNTGLPKFNPSGIWSGLIEPSAKITSEPIRRRGRMLSAMLLVTCLFAMLALVLTFLNITSAPHAIINKFVELLIISIVGLFGAYGLSRTVYFKASALLSVFIFLAASFYAVYLNPAVEYIYAFPIVGGLMSGLFLQRRSTAIVFFFISLITFALQNSQPLNDHSGVAIKEFLVLLSAAIVLLSMTMQRNDLKQIDLQSQSLAEREHKMKISRDKSDMLADSLAQQVNELNNRTTEYNLLSIMNTNFLSCQSIQEVGQVFAQFGPKLFPAFFGAVYLTNASRTNLEITVSWDQPEKNEQGLIFSITDCLGLRRGQKHLMQPGIKDISCPHVEAAHRSEFANLCLPLHAQGEALGILYLSGKVIEQKISETHQMLAQNVSESLSMAFANMNLQATLKHQSIRDPLTGLFNRRYFEDSFERELKNAMRNMFSLGLISIDIDLFKVFNDKYGHQAGDVLLHELGNLFLRAIRATDIACRLGDEEFLLILPETTLDDCLKIADDLRVKISVMNVSYKGQILDAVTISAGIASFPENGLDTESLLRKVEMALYRAKHEGRNQVVAAENNQVENQTKPLARNQVKN